MRTNGGYYWIQSLTGYWVIAQWNERHNSWELFKDKWVNIYSTLEVCEEEIKPPIKTKSKIKPKLTPDGESRLNVLLDWLEERGLKKLFLRRVKESKREDYGMEVIIREVNDPECSMNILITIGLFWQDTLEGDEFWAWVDRCFDEYLEDN